MSYALNNTATANAYGSCTLSCAGSVKQQITVANAGVFMTPTYRNLAGAQTTGAEIFYPPGFYAFRSPVDQVQFRSAVSGTPALVTVLALLLAEANQ